MRDYLRLALAWLRAALHDHVALKPSIVRLVALVLTFDASVVSATICIAALMGKDASLVAALVGALTALVGSGVVALFSRTKPSELAAGEDEVVNVKVGGFNSPEVKP